MGFRGSRVQIPPSRLSEDQALQRLSLWGFFCACTPCCEFCCESFPLQRLTIRCVGCNTTCRTVSASGCWRSEEHTSELQSLRTISYAVFCLKKKKKKHTIDNIITNIYITTEEH